MTLTAFCLTSLLLASGTSPFTARAHVRGVSVEAEYEAIQQALALALTDAVSTWIPDPRPWAGDLARDVFSRKAQYVSEYAVVSGSDNPDGTGLHREVRVVVEMPELARTLVDLGLLHYASSGGRAAVVVDAPGGERTQVRTALLQWGQRWGLAPFLIEAGSQEALGGLIDKAGDEGAQCLLLIRGQESAPGRVRLEGLVIEVPGGDELTHGSGVGDPVEAVRRLADAWSWRPASTGPPVATLPVGIVVDGYGTDEAARLLDRILGIPGVAVARDRFSSQTGVGASILWCGDEELLERAVRGALGPGNAAEVQAGVLHVLPLTAAGRNDVSVVSFHVEDLFPACLGHYAEHAPATLRAVNRSPSGTAVHVAVEAPQYARLAAHASWGVLAPGEEREERLLLPLDTERVLSVTQDVPLHAEAVVSYDGGDARATAAAVLHRRSAIDWARLPSVCAFVNPREEAVVRLAGLASALPGLQMPRQLPGNLGPALEVWACVAALELEYRPDPGVARGDVYDDVHFPTETIARSGGDCEDLSVLFAACLEAAGVPAMIVVTEDHVLTAFDTGLTEKNGALVSVTRDDILVKADHVWLPVECTELREGFVRAWGAGVSRCRDIIGTDGSLEMVVVEEGWKVYPPISPPFEELETALPSTRAVDDRRRAAVDSFLERWETQVAEELERLEALRGSDPELSVYGGGVLLAQLGRLEDAEGLFGSMRNTAWAANNLANVLLLKGDASGAATGYREALALSDDEGIWANLALAYYALASDEGDSLSNEAMAQALLRAGGEGQIRRLLGIGVFDAPEAAKASGPRRVSRQDVLRVLAQAKKQVPREVVQRPATVHVLAGRKALGPEELQELALHLYWKPPDG